jgi:transposase InsO family protein
LGLQRPVKKRKTRTTNSDHPFPRYPNLVKGETAARPDDIWVADITYVRLEHGFVYLAVLMDVFTRAVRGWHLSRSLDHHLTLKALERVLAGGHSPLIHHSDQGLQYACKDYTD